MSENPLEEFVNQFLGDRQEETGQPEEERAVAQNQRLTNALQTLAGSAAPELRDEIGAFLGGQGTLLETTRASVAKSSGTGVNNVAKLLTKTFKVKEPLASLLATLLVKVLPGVVGKTGQDTAAEPKPKKKKTAASTAKKPATKPKKTAKSSTSKKTISKTKPKKAAGKKTATKPKTAKKTAAKKPAKKKTASRTAEISA